MAKLLVISSRTAKENIQEEGDIVCIRPDSHEFSEHEKHFFTIIQVKGDPLELQKKLRELISEYDAAREANKFQFSIRPLNSQEMNDLQNSGIHARRETLDKIVKAY